MRYKLKDIGEAGLEIRVELGPAWLTAECPDVVLRPSAKGIFFKGQLDPMGEGFLLRGDLRGAVVGQCARCLEDAEIPVDSPVVATFVEELSDEDAEEIEEGSEEVLIENGIVDIGPTIRDELLLTLPMNPICNEACKGICLTCGVNRNLTQCECADAPRADSKFAALAKMRRE